MSPNPIAKVLSTLRRRRVRSLLMGGQACILHGAAEFSRDVDFAVAPTAANLDRLRAALSDLSAERLYFPPLAREPLLRGHACHFRCRARGVSGLRIDVMSVMRNADRFDRLWARRVRMALPGAGEIGVMSVPDLARIKKTQRDKDWPMVRRLVEADILRRRGVPPPSRVRFWFEECRTPELLLDLARLYPKRALEVARRRPAVAAARRGRVREIERCLRHEETRERAMDRAYWAPLRAELERWRLGRGMPS